MPGQKLVRHWSEDHWRSLIYIFMTFEICDRYSLNYRRLRGDLIEVFEFIKGRRAGYLWSMFVISKVKRGEVVLVIFGACL